MSKLTMATFNRLPIVSIILILILCLFFVQFKKQDSVIWDEIITKYQQQLLFQELPIYLEFVARRWSVERIGSQFELDSLNNKSDEKAFGDLTRLILADKAFFPYLKSDGHLFMSQIELRALVKKRQVFQVLVSKLSASRFGLVIDEYGASDFITHSFVGGESKQFVFGILFFLVISVLVERAILQARFCLLLVSSCIASTLGYLLVADAFSPVHHGLTSLTYGLYFSYIAFITDKYKGLSVPSHFSSPYNFKKELIFGLVFLVALLCITSFEWINGQIDLSVLSAYFFTAIWGSVFIQVNKKLLGQVAVHDINVEDNWPMRVALAKAMNKISHFDFDSARADLSLLHQRYPESSTILEQQYHLEKLRPNDGEYWRCAHELIDLCAKENNYSGVLRLFKDIQKNAATKQRARISLQPESYHKMMMVFVANDDLQKAEQAFLFLELDANNDIKKDACKLLIDEYRIRGNLSKQEQYQKLFERIC